MLLSRDQERVVGLLNKTRSLPFNPFIKMVILLFDTTDDLVLGACLLVEHFSSCRGCQLDIIKSVFPRHQ